MSGSASDANLDERRRKWLSGTLKLHVDALVPPMVQGGTLPPVPNLQLRPPSMPIGPAVPNFAMPNPPASPQAAAEQPDVQLSRDGVEIEAEATRPPQPGLGQVQLFPSARLTARTPWNGGPVGPDVRGPVTSIEAGATVAQVGNEALNAQLRASLENGGGAMTPHATLHVEGKFGKVNVQVEGDTTGSAHEVSVGIGGHF